MDISADVDQIIAKAPNWNIEGDCALLALMKRISQNLHERVDKTSSRFEEFEVSVKRADIALSNANNSLRSLQFGQQFVEYRVEEIKDEDLAMPQDKKEPETPPMSSEEMAKQFLENNLRMFRKNYEPVTIEVPDSDDEDAPVTTTTVFRAKNPYDAIPLPYIIGSKEWNEHKYAGLYDSKENSEDEKSEEFSSSSSDEREPVPSTSTKAANKPVEPHMSDSSSLASLPKEPKIISPTKAPNPLPIFPTPTPPAGAVKEPAPKSSQPRPIISSQRNPHEHDMFAALRQSPPSDDPPSTSSSPTSSPAFGTVPGRLPKVSTASISSSSNSPAHQPPPTLFDETIAPQTSREAQLPEAPKPAETKPSQVKRKPVNIFSDDEFNSFMSEITQKVQAKAGSSSNTTPASDTVSPTQSLPKKTQPEAQKVPKESQTKINPTVPTPSVPKRVNLFDDSPPLSPTPATSSTSSDIPPKGPQQNPPKPISFDAPASSTMRTSDLPPKNPPKALPKSLFDDDLEDDDFLSSFTPKPKPPEQKQKPKSLFDDDDLDVDDIFSKPSSKPKNLSTKVAGKTSLFDDDDQDDVADLFGSKKLSTKRLEESPPKTLLEKSVEPPIPHRKSLFDDIEEEDLFGTPKANNLFASREQISPISPEKSQGEVEKSRHIKEIKTKEIQNKEFKQVVPDDTFRPIHDQKSQATVAVQHQKEAKDVPPTTSTKPTDLFKDDFNDDDSFLTVSQPKVKPQSSTETKEAIKPAERKFVPPKQDIPIPQSEPIKLFDEKVVQDEPKTKSIPHVPENTKETIDPTEDLIKEIDPEKNPTDKIDDEPVRKQKDSLADKFSPISESPPPDDHQNQQDPIISMVADITNKSPKTEPTPRRAADLAAAQQIMQNYTNLFSEEPPDDSEFFQTLGSSGLSSLSASKIFDHEQDFFEPALPKVPSATKSSVVSPSEVQPSPSDYKGMRLFSDVPPEDFGSDPVPEKQVEPQKVETSSTTTRIHTIFYDDFSETARAGTVPTTPKHSVSAEKPPPADEPDRGNVKEASELPAPASPVKKLKMPNININVQALLPGSGARPKVLKKPETPHLDEDSQVPAHPDSLVTSPKEPVTPQSTEGGLQHVNKTRVRGPPRRRPSTRKGRQENYEKSLLEDERINQEVEGSNMESPDQDDSESISIQSPSAMTAPQENVLSSPVALFDEPPEDKPTPEKASVGTKKSTPSSFPKSFLDSPDEDDFLSNPPRKQSSVGDKRITPSTKAKSFLDSPDEDDFLSNPPKIQSSVGTKKITPSTRAKSFLDSPDEDDFLSNPPKKQSSVVGKSVSIGNPPTAILNEPPEDQAPLKVANPRKVASFLDSSDEDDSLFKTENIRPPVGRISAPATKSIASETSKDLPKNMVPPKAGRSFLDSDDESPFPALAPPPKLQTVTAPEKNISAAPNPLRTNDPPLMQSKTAPTKQIKLFDDSDDDDDLFATASLPAPVPTAQTTSKPTTQSKQPAKQKASLFSSDEDDELIPAKAPPKKKLPAKATKSLFSDDDDDDDLFGGRYTSKASTSKQTRPSSRSTAKPAPSKTSSASSKTPSDNPLADLLFE